MLAGFLRALNALPVSSGEADPDSLPSIPRGERICRAYPEFQSLVPDTEITIEHANAPADGTGARRANGARAVFTRMSAGSTATRNAFASAMPNSSYGGFVTINATSLSLNLSQMLRPTHERTIELAPLKCAVMDGSTP